MPCNSVGLVSVMLGVVLFFLLWQNVKYGERVSEFACVRENECVCAWVCLFVYRFS